MNVDNVKLAIKNSNILDQVIENMNKAGYSADRNNAAIMMHVIAVDIRDMKDRLESIAGYADLTNDL